MYIRETNSTNTLLRTQYSEELPNLYTIRTDYQTAGRGQAGNGWESEDGKNLLFSTLIRSDIRPAEQFRLTMSVSVAMWEMLSEYLPNDLLSIKWPNDIYYGDKKLAGILVENILSGDRIAYSIAGIGLNVNQLEFKSGAPNPISMRQITGEAYDVEVLLSGFLNALQVCFEMSPEALKEAYMAHLYRRKGAFPYIEREVSIAPTMIARADEAEKMFMAEIEDVTPLGQLVLRTGGDEVRTYHFKQIRFVIE